MGGLHLLHRFFCFVHFFQFHHFVSVNGVGQVILGGGEVPTKIYCPMYLNGFLRSKGARFLGLISIFLILSIFSYKEKSKYLLKRGFRFGLSKTGDGSHENKGKAHERSNLAIGEMNLGRCGSFFSCEKLFFEVWRFFKKTKKRISLLKTPYYN